MSRGRFLTWGHGFRTILETKGRILIHVTSLCPASGKSPAEIIFSLLFHFVFDLDATPKPANSRADAACAEWRSAVPLPVSGRELPLNTRFQLSSGRSLTEMRLRMCAFCLLSRKWFGKRKGNTFASLSLNFLFTASPSGNS